jgi:hypothetical protein
LWADYRQLFFPRSRSEKELANPGSREKITKTTHTGCGKETIWEIPINMKQRFWHIIVLNTSRFVLYCTAIVTGLGGLLYGGIPLLKYMTYRLAGTASGTYMAFNFSFDRDCEMIIVVLSFMLLILADIGYAVGVRLHSPKTAETVPVDARPAGSLAPPQKQMCASPPTLEQMQKETALERANQKLDALVKNEKDNRLS